MNNKMHNDINDVMYNYQQTITAFTITNLQLYLKIGQHDTDTN